MHSDGYTGEILYVDLSDGTTRRRKYPCSWKVRYIGGRGFGVKIVSDLVKPGTDPLSPENVIAFMAGPLTGSGVPMGSRYDVSGVSPLTGTLSSANSGGHFGPVLKRAGLDGIVISGKSESCVALCISPGHDVLKKADDLWGKTVSETTRELKDSLGDPNTRVACIGPAGERLSRIAAIMNDVDRAAARGGLGAVLGAKKLKAIAVTGDSGVEDRTPAFREAIENIRHIIRDKGLSKGGLATHGTAVLTQVIAGHGILPTRNHQDTYTGDPEAISGETLTSQYLTGRSACHSCPVACGRVIRLDGVKSGGPEYETIWALGANCGVYSLPHIIRANRLCNELGIDTISMGVTIACAMELSEKGYLSERIRFGDAEGMVRLVRETGFRTGIGNDLAEGSYRFAEKCGHPDVSMTSKRLELPGYDPRGLQGQGLEYATSVRGGCHVYGNMLYPEVLGVPVKLDPYIDSEKAFWTKRLQDQAAAIDATGLCLFAARALDISHISGLLAVQSGRDVSVDELLFVGERIWNLQRVFNLRAGIDPSEDCLPSRLTGEPIGSGPAKGRVWRGHPLIEEYYALRGWDETGWPTKKKLDELGLKMDGQSDPLN